MKKTLSLALILVLALTVISAQALENPFEPCASLSAVNEALGCHLSRPAVMGVADENYGIIRADEESNVGEYAFTVNGMAYCYRFCADYEKDISGVYINAAPAFTGTAGEIAYAADASYKLARWANVDGQYTLAIKDDGALTQEQFEGIAQEIMATSVPEENDGFVGGTYHDTYSMRATAEAAVQEDGSVFIVVCWGSSAFESTYWTMTATFDGDNKLVYTDGTTFTLNVDADYNEIITDFAENLAGYFVIENNELAWVGAPDEQCQLCTFVPAAE